MIDGFFLTAIVVITGIGLMAILATYLNPDEPEQEEADYDPEFERPMDPVGAALLTVATRDANEAVAATEAMAALAGLAAGEPAKPVSMAFAPEIGRAHV